MRPRRLPGRGRALTRSTCSHNRRGALPPTYWRVTDGLRCRDQAAARAAALGPSTANARRRRITQRLRLHDPSVSIAWIVAAGRVAARGRRSRLARRWATATMEQEGASLLQGYHPQPGV